MHPRISPLSCVISDSSPVVPRDPTCDDEVSIHELLGRKRNATSRHESGAERGGDYMYFAYRQLPCISVNSD